MIREINFYRKENGICPVEDFLDSLEEKTVVKILAVFCLLENEKIISSRFFKKIEGTKLFEVRVKHSSNIYRFPCFFEEDKLIILTHGFTKKTNKLPKNEINRAVKYYNDYKRSKQ